MPDAPLYQPPAPGGDLRTMLRRHLVATALGQLDAAADARGRLRSAADWRTHAAGVRRRFAAALEHPDLVRRETWRVRRQGGRDCGEFSFENLLVESLPGAWMNVTVWKPDPRRWAPPWPTVVTPVGHNSKRTPNEQYPPQVFAANGYLAVSFDPPGFGEKAPGNDHFVDGVRGYVVGQNPLVFFLADALRAVDYVLSRRDVDPRPGVAMTGVSGGGFSTVCCSLLDPRLTVLGPSCFGLPDELHPVRNGYAGCPETQWWRRFADGLGLSELLIGTRFRPLLLMAGRHDTVLTARHLGALVAPVRRAYAAVGEAKKFRVLVDDCGHEYTPNQACAFVAWMRCWSSGRSWTEPVRMPRRLRLLDEADLRGNPPFGLCMATAAARAARARLTVTNATQARRALTALIPGFARHRRDGLAAVSSPGSRMGLWTHQFQEFSLRDGADWELPATLMRPESKSAGALVFFDDRGRWAGLHQWGWLNCVTGFFGTARRPRGVLTVDLPGWGDTRPLPSPYDVVGWGGVDRWAGYLSAATGESVMAMRVRDAVRVLDHVRREWKLPAERIVVGGFGVGADVAALAALLHGSRLGGLLMLEPLARFADLATEPKAAWPHDAYFPNILKAVDVPEAVRLQGAPALVVGPRDGGRRLLGRRASAVFSGPRVRVVAGAFSDATEGTVRDWLQRLP
ncbi:MAG TPA: hypothetical protein PLB90_11075 [Opitutaceae bacterium]|nr:hypothetical protein [Opitutaceae bacterium]